MSAILRKTHSSFVFQFLFVLINGAVRGNSRSLGYFGLKTNDLPRVGIYDGDSDMKWLLPEGEITNERVREFCQSFLRGDLKVSRRSGFHVVNLYEINNKTDRNHFIMLLTFTVSTKLLTVLSFLLLCFTLHNFNLFLTRSN